MTEMLAALAIASMIILSAGSLIHQTLFFFDRGTSVADQSEELALAVDRLARDFSSARFVVTETTGSAGNNDAVPDVKAAFTANIASEDGPASLMFLTAGGHGAGQQSEEAVKLTVEDHDGVTELIRYSAVWPGPIMSMETMSFDDSVVLLKGRFAISFSYGELSKEGDLLWHDNWSGEMGLPYSVRINLRNRETNADLVPGVAFRIRADAPPSCTLLETECYLIARDTKSPVNRELSPQEGAALR